MGNDNSKDAPPEEQLKNLQAFFKNTFPNYLIEGPYKTSAKLVLATLYIALFAIRYHISQHNESEGYDLDFDRDSIFKTESIAMKVKFGGFLYGLFGLYYMYKEQGIFPLASYTMQSWSLTTLRFGFGSLALLLQSKIFKDFEEILRFPSLVQNTVTFGVWWFVLVPFISLALSLRQKKLDVNSKATGRFVSFQAFLKWNFSPFLLNVHGINLPFAFLAHLIEPRELKLLDLWHGLFFAISYLTFYLTVLDRNKVPLYIILSPRSFMGPISYVGIMALYGGIFHFVNSHSAYLSQVLKSYIAQN